MDSFETSEIQKKQHILFGFQENRKTTQTGGLRQRGQSPAGPSVQAYYGKRFFVFELLAAVSPQTKYQDRTPAELRRFSFTLKRHIDTSTSLAAWP